MDMVIKQEVSIWYKSFSRGRGVVLVFIIHTHTHFAFSTFQVPLLMSSPSPLLFDARLSHPSASPP
jgi:hypothetical protein